VRRVRYDAIGFRMFMTLDRVYRVWSTPARGRLLRAVLAVRGRRLQHLCCSRTGVRNAIRKRSIQPWAARGRSGGSGEDWKFISVGDTLLYGSLSVYAVAIHPVMAFEALSETTTTSGIGRVRTARSVNAIRDTGRLGIIFEGQTFEFLIDSSETVGVGVTATRSETPFAWKVARSARALRKYVRESTIIAILAPSRGVEKTRRLSATERSSASIPTADMTRTLPVIWASSRSRTKNFWLRAKWGGFRTTIHFTIRRVRIRDLGGIRCRSVLPHYERGSG